MKKKTTQEGRERGKKKKERERKKKEERKKERERKKKERERKRGKKEKERDKSCFNTDVRSRINQVGDNVQLLFDFNPSKREKVFFFFRNWGFFRFSNFQMRKEFDTFFPRHTRACSL